MVLDIFSYAWVQLQSSATEPQHKQRLAKKIDKTIMALVSSYKGTEAIPLLSFLGDLFRKLDPEVIPQNPKWLIPVVAFIRNLVMSRPEQTGRAAYTNLCATLLQVYPVQAPRLLFSGAPTPSKTFTKTTTQETNPFSFLLVSLLLVDIRASMPVLLEQLNSPTYPALSNRLSSAYDTISHFISHLVHTLDSPSSSQESLTLSSKNLLTLRKSLSETMSDTIVYLRDRYDSAVAGAMGLDPSARSGPAYNTVEVMTVAWDSSTDPIESDRFVLSAVRALALWLREDEGDVLRREASAVMDLFTDLYRSSMRPEKSLDFREAIIVALEGICETDEGRDALLNHEGWKLLTTDLLSILKGTATTNSEMDAGRGIEIIRILLVLIENEQPYAKDEWTDLITGVAAWSVPDAQQTPAVVEFEVAALQLVSGLLEHSHPTVRRRFEHSIGDIIRLAKELREEKVQPVQDEGLTESLDEVLETLEGLKL